MSMFLFWSTDVIFCNLMKNGKTKILKKLKIKKNSSHLSFIFLPKNCLYFFSINDFFAQITFSCSL